MRPDFGAEEVVAEVDPNEGLYSAGGSQDSWVGSQEDEDEAEEREAGDEAPMSATFGGADIPADIPAADIPAVDAPRIDLGAGYSAPADADGAVALPAPSEPPPEAQKLYPCDVA